MLNTCNVHGVVYTPDGALARDCQIRFLVAHRRVSAQEGNTIVPRAVIARTNDSGLLCWEDEAGHQHDFVPLAPGGYEVRIATSAGDPYTPVAVGIPDEPSAEFATTLDVPPPVTVVQGPKGDTGEPGPPGPAGERGPVGPPGADGRDGTDGAQGPAGPPGADGADGVDGQDGADGRNAEILAFDHDQQTAYDAAVAANASNPWMLVVRYAEP